MRLTGCCGYRKELDVNNLSSIIDQRQPTSESMVRRIIPDSDFESDGETQQEVTQKDNGTKSPLPSPLGEGKPPPSTRPLVRGNELKQKPRATYDYDSDIYTEDSSMGSFILYSEEEGNQEEEDASGD
jgi:hypothetical protein